MPAEVPFSSYYSDRRNNIGLSLVSPPPSISINQILYTEIYKQTCMNFPPVLWGGTIWKAMEGRKPHLTYCDLKMVSSPGTSSPGAQDTAEDYLIVTERALLGSINHDCIILSAVNITPSLTHPHLTLVLFKSIVALKNMLFINSLCLSPGRT